MGGYILVGSSRLLGGELRRDGGFLFKDRKDFRNWYWNIYWNIYKVKFGISSESKCCFMYR